MRIFKLCSILLLNFIFVSCVKLSSFENDIKNYIEQEYAKEDSCTINLSNIFHMDWDTLFVTTSTTPTEYLKNIMNDSTNYPIGYRRFILKKGSRVVLHSAANNDNSSTSFFDIGIDGSIFFPITTDDSRGDGYFAIFTTKNFKVNKVKTSDSYYYILSPSFSE